MRITIDIECPAWMRKVARIAIPALIITTSGTVLAVPNDFTAGQTLTAAQLNQNFTDVESQIGAVADEVDGVTADLDANVAALDALDASAVKLTAWQAYTPVVADAGNGAPLGVSATGVYRRVGDSIEVHVRVTNPLGTSSGSVMAISIPSGLSVESGKMATLGLAGIAQYYQPSAAQISMCNVYIGSALASALVFCQAGNLTPSSLDTASAELILRFTVPIQGWTTTSP